MIKKTLAMLPIGEIYPYERNNKDHLEENVQELVEHFNTVGVIDPIYVDDKHVILAGHKRWMAHKKIGSELVECFVVTGFKSEEHKKLYRIASNKLTHNSDWDIDNLITELPTLKEHFDLEALGIMFDLEPPKIDLDVDEPDHAVDKQKRCEHCGAWMS